MTLEDIARASPATLDSLSIDVLADLKEQADGHLASASQMVAILHGVFSRRYAAGLNNTGTFNRTDGQYVTKVTVPKNVTWDAEKLAGAVDTIRGWGENPSDYVETKLSVAESKYSAWPPAIRDLFTLARTVKPGKAKFELHAANAEAA